MKKKIAAVILAAAMAAGTLAGCGSSDGNDGSTGTGTDSSAAVSSEAAVPEDVYEVVMQWPSVGEAPEGLSAVEDAINALDSVKGIGVQVKLEPGGAFNLSNDTSLAVSSGNKLDICLSLYSGVGSLVENGCLIELDDLLEQYGQDILDACGEMQITGGMYQNKQYAVPISYVNGSYMGYICRGDILKKYDIEVDTEKIYTMEELEEIFATVKAGEGDGFYLLAGGYSELLPFGAFYQYDTLGQSTAGGVIMMDGDLNTIVDIYETEEYAAYADTMYRWAQAGYFPADASTSSEDSGNQLKAGNYMGMFLSDLVGETAVSYSSRTGHDIVCLRTRMPFACSGSFQTTLWSIASTSEKPDRAMQFLNLVYKDAELTNLLQYGIKNVDYEIVEQDEAGTVIRTAENAAYSQPLGVYGDRLKWHVLSPMTTETNNQLRAASDAVTQVSPALGYIFDVSKVSAQYAAVNSVISQYQAIINTGAIDPAAEVPEFVKALKDAGIDAVIAENQSQYDAWRAETGK